MYHSRKHKLETKQKPSDKDGLITIDKEFHAKN
jgi:hypothetical protein